MGKLFKQYIDSRRIYICRQCKSHITSHKELVSKTFTGQYGRAFLFNTAINISKGPPEEKALLTGLHIVRDIFCKFCRLLIG
mmetsp:Transcript_21129/g.3439  ORF Transcript_21129/g.3439 Transcript_21129/m.3439 type:complete len:82 (-) Transcript_21129:1610-1855(-)